MAASRIKGITIEIGGDTTKLQTALKGVNTEIRNTQQQLKDCEKLLKLDPGNTELLAQKHILLGQAVEETKNKLETLKTAQQQADEALKNGMISAYNRSHTIPLPKFTPHNCRHTFSTKMSRMRMYPKDLQYIMGHSDYKVTMNTYTHLDFEDAVRELKRVNEQRMIG